MVNRPGRRSIDIRGKLYLSVAMRRYICRAPGMAHRAGKRHRPFSHVRTVVPLEAPRLRVPKWCVQRPVVRRVFRAVTEIAPVFGLCRSFEGDHGCQRYQPYVHHQPYDLCTVQAAPPSETGRTFPVCATFSFPPASLLANPFNHPLEFTALLSFVEALRHSHFHWLIWRFLLAISQQDIFIKNFNWLFFLIFCFTKKTINVHATFLPSSSNKNNLIIILF